VLTHEPDTGRRFYELVQSWREARLVTQGDFSFEPGVDVTDVQQAKGLEFDYVILPDVTAHEYPATDDARRLLHVGITRAASQLWIVSPGVTSPLLPPS
jgi:DNA helicase-2/ATP-dependent DNA helicase PcrA